MPTIGALYEIDRRGEGDLDRIAKLRASEAPPHLDRIQDLVAGARWRHARLDRGQRQRRTLAASRLDSRASAARARRGAAGPGSYRRALSIGDSRGGHMAGFER